MSKFARWSGIVRSSLSKSYPKLKLGQAQEILAAAFGHRTYASFRTQDISRLERDTKYALIDNDMALSRATSLGVPITAEAWDAAVMSLRPSGVSGETWLISEEGLHLAASIAFEDSSHAGFTEIASSIGMSDGRRARSTHCRSSDGSLPEVMYFTVHGEVRAFNSNESLAVPVVGDVVFNRVGRRFYAKGELLSVARSGEPGPYDHEDMFEDYGMSED